MALGYMEGMVNVMIGKIKSAKVGEHSKLNSVQNWNMISHRGL